ncbi:MAG: hypothetical protein LBV30_08260 [Propionibacteriaceae bacterium]|nr:hypothetical protein [Propionibacteriaceae bacterium]
MQFPTSSLSMPVAGDPCRSVSDTQVNIHQDWVQFGHDVGELLPQEGPS